jgi:altronate dehydratase small subunit
MKALVLHRDDNVATAVAALAAGDKVSLDGAAEITLLEPVPFGHKLARHDIRPGRGIFLSLEGRG